MGEVHCVGQRAELPATRGVPGWRFRFPRARRLALGVLAAFLALGCGTENRPGPEKDENRRRASGVATPALKVGDPLPPLRAEGWVNGPPPAPNSPGVRLLVVDAWGEWCPLCEMSTAGLLRVYQKYSGQGVAFVSLTSAAEDTVEIYVRRHSVPWPNGYGVTAETAAALGAGSGLPGPIDYEVAPTLYLVGPDGRIRWVDGRGRARHQDPREWENAVDAAIAETLASLPKSKP